jgi:hypothetical protein
MLARVSWGRHWLSLTCYTVPIDDDIEAVVTNVRVICLKIGLIRVALNHYQHFTIRHKNKLRLFKQTYCVMLHVRTSTVIYSPIIMSN